MRSRRLTISGLMAVVAVVALVATALRTRSDEWARVLFLATCGTLALAVVGAACRGGAERAWWLGASCFGWGYLGLVSRGFDFPAGTVLGPLQSYFGLPPAPRRGGFCIFGGGAYLDPNAQDSIGHCLCALGFATLGGVLARLLFHARPDTPPVVAPRPGPPPRVSRRPGPRRAIVEAAAVLGVVGVSLIGLRWAPGPSAAAALIATWGVVALNIVGAVYGRGPRRAACLGAALFGAGYMALIFGPRTFPEDWPKHVTDRLLQDLQSRLPYLNPSGSPTNPNANDWVFSALERPVSFPFAEEIPFEDFLKYVEKASIGKDGRGIPIYVDPIGLQEQEKTINVPVVIHLKDVPIRTGLRLVLRQLGLTYVVVDGVVIVTSEDSETQGVVGPAAPFLVVGHCLLALFAARLGGLLSRFAVGLRAEPL